MPAVEVCAVMANDLKTTYPGAHYKLACEAGKSGFEIQKYLVSHSLFLPGITASYFYHHPVNVSSTAPKMCTTLKSINNFSPVIR
jgi:hypothetical protein